MYGTVNRSVCSTSPHPDIQGTAYFSSHTSDFLFKKKIELFKWQPYVVSSHINCCLGLVGEESKIIPRVVTLNLCVDRLQESAKGEGYLCVDRCSGNSSRPSHWMGYVMRRHHLLTRRWFQFQFKHQTFLVDRNFA